MVPEYLSTKLTKLTGELSNTLCELDVISYDFARGKETDATLRAVLETVAQRTRELIAAKEEEVWQCYLDNLSQTVPADLVAQVRHVWDILSEIAPIPQSGPTEEGWTFVWDQNEHHVEIDFDLLTVFWFYRNRTTDEVVGGDTDLQLLRSAVSVYFSRFRARTSAG